MTETPHRLLICVNTDQFAGAEQSLQTLITHLPSSVVVTVVGPDRAVLDELVRDRRSAVVCETPLPSDKTNLGQGPSLWRLLSRFKPCVVHLNKTEVADLRYVELLLNWQRLGPVVSVVHHVERPTSLGARILTRLLARRASAVVAVDGRVGQELEPILGLPAGSIHVIPNALPPFDPAARLPAMRRPEDGFVVGVLARLVPHKGVANVVRAVASLPDTRLVVGGDGPERQSLEQLAWGLKASDRVTFLGWVDPDEVFDRCDVLVSAASIEGHSMALLDARRRGLPIVAADVGGVSTVVKHQVTGLLVPPCDVVGLAKAIDRVRTSPQLQTSMKRAALAAAHAAPDPGAMVDEYCSLYWPHTNS